MMIYGLLYSFASYIPYATGATRSGELILINQASFISPVLLSRFAIAQPAVNKGHIFIALIWDILSRRGGVCTVK